MSIKCVWCGKDIEDVDGVATMDTCDECEDYFEDHIDDIVSVLNKMLLENENADDKDKASAAWKSYSLISAIHMLSSKPNIEFKDSKYKDFLTR